MVIKMTKFLKKNIPPKTKAPGGNIVNMMFSFVMTYRSLFFVAIYTPSARNAGCKAPSLHFWLDYCFRKDYRP